MLKKITIYNTIWFFFLILIFLRFKIIVDGVQLLFLTIYKLLNTPSKITQKLDLETLDLLNSILLIIVIPILVYLINKRYKLLNIKLRLSYFVFIILIFSLLYAPIITNFHPNAQPNISATRFLPPLSSVSVIHLNIDENYSGFDKLKNETVNYSIIKNKIFINSVKEEGNYLFYQQGNNRKGIEKSKIETRNGEADITKKYFIFGTDELGRDIFARIIYGGRVSLFIAFFTVAISLTIGLVLGFFAAYFGGVFNLILSRFTDVFLTIPSIFFVIMILAFWGNSIFAVIIVLGLTGWMSFFKVIKGEVASIVQKDYFISSKKIGLPISKLLAKEILPSILIQIIVATVLQFSNVILAEASLSYLGLGVGINYPSWGNMILSGQQYMSSGGWLIIIPAAVLILSILAINDFGEKMKEELNPWIENDK